MQIKKENKLANFFRRFGVYVIGAVVVIVVAVAATVAGVLSKSSPSTPVDTKPISFISPLVDASLIKDFSDTKLQKNETLNKFEAHKCVDITSENPAVLAVADGTVTDVFYKYMSGYTITISHKDGFTSVYSSLDENVNVEKGDAVKQGDKIGEISTSAAGEASYGEHVELALFQNGRPVDPNNYISFQVK